VSGFFRILTKRGDLQLAEYCAMWLAEYVEQKVTLTLEVHSTTHPERQLFTWMGTPAAAGLDH